MTYVRVWRFRPHQSELAAFEAAYRLEGDWARLFCTARGFLGTTLLRGEGTPAEYVTIDRWISRAAYDTFRRDRSAEFTVLDRRCESLTAVEEEIGAFDELP